MRIPAPASAPTTRRLPLVPGRRGLLLEEINGFFAALRETVVMLETSARGGVSVAERWGETRHK